MDVNHFLTAYLPDPSADHRRMYQDMIDQAVAADALGYHAVSIPEHHLVNILLVPAPLQLAVRLAAATSRIRLVTAVVVLPLHDMRMLAGELAQADMLCDGRLVVGVGRGAFPYEMARLGAPIETSRERFAESMEVLQALLSRDDVAWDGEYYRFGPLTTLPRPVRPIPFMVAAMAPGAIEDAALRGYHVQTTPLGASHETLLDQAGAFHRGREQAGAAGEHLRLAMMRGVYAAADHREARAVLERAYEYYRRFDNVFSGPGIVHAGRIEPLPRSQTIEELGQNLVICPPDEMIERLAGYADVGIDELVMSSNFGQPLEQTLEMMQRFAEEVLPHLGAANRHRGERI
jgi:alkanesulfonate monooxygenase SsuD/methylene tetrahydromethanopterin reductase-like flavin-dependent oxidoreductase (luciferase family)